MNTAAAIKLFALAGKAIFTVASTVSGSRYTYKVRAKVVQKDGKDITLHFVSVLTGPENTTDYTFLGTIFPDGSYRHGSRSSIAPGAPSARGFTWFWGNTVKGHVSPACTVTHCGRCGKCGKLLTVPESVLSGFGPECSAAMGLPVPVKAKAPRKPRGKAVRLPVDQLAAAVTATLADNGAIDADENSREAYKEALMDSDGPGWRQALAAEALADGLV